MNAWTGIRLDKIECLETIHKSERKQNQEKKRISKQIDSLQRMNTQNIL